MNTDKAFIGFNKNGEEILVYKKNNNTYINLLSKDNSVYPTNNIQLDSLIPYSNIINTFKYTTRKNIVKNYLYDRYTILDISKVKMCDFKSIDNLKVYIDPSLDYHIYWDYKNEGRGLFVENKEKYKEVITNQEYNNQWNIKERNMKHGYVYVAEDRSCVAAQFIREELSKNPTKKEVVETAYKLKSLRRKKEL